MTSSVAISDAGTGTPTESELTPESLGVDQAVFEKYYDAENKTFDYASHWKEIQWQEKQKAGTAEPPPETTPEPTDIQDAGAAQSAVAQAGLDWGVITEMALRNGKLDDESFQQLVDIGLPPSLINDFVSSKYNEAQGHVKAVHERFGGEEKFNEAARWAQQNMSQTDIDAMSERLSGADWRAAAAELLDKAGLPAGKGTAASGTASAPATTGTKSSEPFANDAEFMSAMRDPKYKTDKAFRENVWARAKATDAKGQTHRPPSSMTFGV